MSKSTVIAGLVGLATSGLVALAPAAGAAPPALAASQAHRASAAFTSASSKHFHGTAAMAHFPSYGVCQSYASWWVHNITSHGGKIVAGSAGRTKCFPLSNGRWSYLLAYTAPKAINRLDYTVDQATMKRGDTFWLFEHHGEGPASTFTQAQCDAKRKAFDQKVIAGAHVRLIADLECFYNSYTKRRSYLIYYSGTTKHSGFVGDPVSLHSDGVIFEACTLGYVIPEAP